MTKRNSISPVDRKHQTRPLRTLIFARASLVVILAYASYLWTASYLPGTNDRPPESLAVFVIVTMALSIAYLVLLEFAPNLDLQILVQMVFDVFLVTWLLWITGDATSPYFPLYILLIGVSGWFLDKNPVIFIAVFCGVCYTILSSLTSQSFIYSFTGSEPPSRIAQIVGFNDVALLVVGLLAARVTERRRMREQLRETTTSFEDLNLLHERIVASVGSGLIITDLEGTIVGFNRAAEEISGSSASEMIGQSIYDLFGNEIKAPVNLCLKPVEEEGVSVEHFEASIRRNGGEGESRAAVVCSPVPLKTRTGEKYGMIISFQDITRTRNMEESLRRSDRLAAVGRMAAGLAHEIRNPLGSIGSALQYLHGKVEPESREESVLKVVMSEAERLNKIITDFLSYARPRETGRERIDINEAIRETITLIELGPEMKSGHRIEFLRSEKELFVSADEEKLKQVFWNLLRNSLEAMPGGGTIRISTEELKGVHLKVIVEDEGTGMTGEQLEHLYEPFSENTKGAGLGLPIVHKIVLDHGGRIDVFSRPGEGTRVIIELPQ